MMAMQHMEEAGIVSRKDLYLVEPKKIVVRDGWNPRQEFALEELKENIRLNGVKRPLMVRRLADHRLELVDGERRLRAVLELMEEGCEILSVPCILEPQRMSDPELLVDTLVANQGKPFTEFEEAEAFRRFVAWGWELPQIAQRVGRSRTYVQDRLRLLEATPDVQEAVRSKEIPISAAIHVVKAAQEPAMQQALLDEVREQRQHEKDAKAERKANKAVTTPPRATVTGDERFTPQEQRVFQVIDKLGIVDVLTHVARWCELEQQTDLAAQVRDLVAEQPGVETATQQTEVA